MKLYYHIIKPDQMYLRIERDTVGAVQKFLQKNFDGVEWNLIDESEVPHEVVFDRRWPGMDLGFLPERRKKPRD